MRFFRIDDGLVEQLEIVLREFERLNPEYRIVSKALRNELRVLPNEFDLNEIAELIDWTVNLQIDGMIPDQTPSCDMDELLRRSGLRLRDRLN